MTVAYETVWSFETARFRVELQTMPEDLDPADSFEMQEDIDAVHNGDVLWFQARVVVYLDGKTVGIDTLGGCAYNSFEEFYTSHRDRDPMNRNCSIMRAAHGGNVVLCHYFPSMVAEAIADARRNIAKLADNLPKMRAAA